jgi:hypothetical protein
MFPQRSCVEDFIYNAAVFRGGAFGRDKAHVDSDLIGGLIHWCTHSAALFYHALCHDAFLTTGPETMEAGDHGL